MIEESDLTPLEHEAYGWVVRFASGRAGPDDIAALQEWSARSPAHLAAFDHARRTWKSVDSTARDLLLANAAAIPPVARRGGSSRQIGRRAFIGGAIAASAAGAAVLIARPPLGLWPSLGELTADYRTGTGEQRQLALADKVSIEMNTQTSIVLRPSAQDANRIELLSGEAIISALRLPGAVTVLAGDGRVVADDALFNMRYDSRGVCVTCLQGSLRVERGASAQPLSVGQQVVYSDARIESPTTVDPTVVTAWKDGVVIFDATPISDVIMEVNRYRYGKIILTNSQLGHKRFNARFRIANIGEVVPQIEQIFGAKATNLPGGITLLG